MRILKKSDLAIAVPLESQTVKEILSYLKWRPGKFWRQNTGAFAGEYRGKKRFIRFGIEGQGDITGIRSGIRIEIEVKRKGEKQTDSQKNFENMIISEGGVYILAYSLEDVIRRGL